MNFPKRKIPQDTIMLTSMMDMFTIILVFLLFNFSSEEQKDMSIPKDIKVPYSTSEVSLDNAVNVTVSKTAIMVEDKVVARLSYGKKIQAEVEGQKILPLYRELVQIRSKQTNSGKVKESDEGVVLLKADQSISFEVLDKVLKSSGMAGYPKSRFVVFRRES
ncbi:MAG TPA: biopolymer transporter ExbD [Oligoflexia bacterium]|nr:biopolymer transporter ExbD [Oligoflexia bacterium]HMR24004.1 biopolymer transporter ExbD [Oligoflexia bacterium]